MIDKNMKYLFNQIVDLEIAFKKFVGHIIFLTIALTRFLENILLENCLDKILIAQAT